MTTSRFPTKPGVITVEDYYQNITFTINVIKAAGNLYKDAEKNGKNIERRRFDLICNHTLRDLQKMFRWDTKKGTGGNLNESMIYLSKKFPECKLKSLLIARVEHIIPVKIGVDSIRSILLDGKPKSLNEEVLKVVFGPVSLITKEEDDTLKKLKLNDKMPDKNVIMSRYEKAGIGIKNILDGSNINLSEYKWRDHIRYLSNLTLPRENGNLGELFSKFCLEDGSLFK